MNGISLVQQALDDPQVSPDLRFEYTAGSLEDADHGPVSAMQAQLLAQPESLELLVDATPHHDFVAARLKQPALCKLDAATHLQGGRRNAAQGNVCLELARLLDDIDIDVQLGRHHGWFSRLTGQFDQGGQHVLLLPVERAVDFTSGAGAQHDRHIARPAVIEFVPESIIQRERTQQDEHRQCDGHATRNGGPAAVLEAKQIDLDNRPNLTQL